MGRQSVTYFDFSGGLNSESSPVNMSANDAIDLSNVELGRDKSIARRSAIDFLGTDATGDPYISSTFDYTTVEGSFVSDVPTGQQVSLVDSNGDLQKFVFLTYGTSLDIYKYDSPRRLLDLKASDNLLQTLDLSSYTNVKYVSNKTKFIQYKDNIFIVNKYISPLFCVYNTDEELFHIREYDVTVRLDSSDDVKQDRVKFNSKSYLCIKSHAFDADVNKIGDGSDWESYWVLDGPEVATDPAYVVTATGALSSWQPNFTYGLNDEILENGFVWRITHLQQTIVYEPNIDEYTTGSNNNPNLKVPSGSIEPDFTVGNPVLETHTITPSGIGSTPIRYRLTWAQVNTSSDTPEQTYNSSVVDVLDKVFNETDADLDKGRFATGAFSQGRIWLSGFDTTPNTIYYSQTIVSNLNIGRMYQHADPLSATDSDKVDTDGGTLIINEAERILAIESFEKGVVVFANNGVWFVSGTEGFKPTDFSVHKLSDDGIVGPYAFTNIKNGLVYFGVGDGYIIKFEENVFNIPKVDSITAKIHSTYNNLSVRNRSGSSAIFNPATNKLYYLVNTDSFDWLVNYNPSQQPTNLRAMFVLDVTTGAWTKYSLSEDSVGTKVSLSDVFLLDGGTIADTQIVDSLGDVFVDASDEVYIMQDSTQLDKDIQTTFITWKKDGDNGLIGLAEFNTNEVSDFFSSSVDVENNSAFIDVAYQLLGDTIHQKQFPYVQPIFERTESGTLDGSGEDITASGCFMRVDWNWSISNKSKKFGTLRQIYNPDKWTISYYDGALNGREIVTSKLKIRGRGEVMKLHFESDSDKRFKLYGWQLIITGKSEA